MILATIHISVVDIFDIGSGIEIDDGVYIAFDQPHEEFSFRCVLS